jgi:hypothetical protein
VRIHATAIGERRLEGKRNARPEGARASPPIAKDNPMRAQHRAIAVLKLSTHVKELVAQGKVIVAAMTGNPLFPSPTPTLALVTTHLDDLDAAEVVAQTKAKGTAEARDAKVAVVHSDLEHIKNYVQGVADANPATAEATIQSAGLSVKKPSTHTKSDLEAHAGSVSGSAHLVAKSAGGRASYEWQSSTDQKTWVNQPVTLQAKADVSGLTPATLYYFRVRPVTKAGEGDWSQVVSLVVR